MIERKLIDNVHHEKIFLGTFCKNLLFSCYQFIADIKSAQVNEQLKTTMSAGLPHFAVNYTRCWGRDVFISFKGIFLLTGISLKNKIIIIKNLIILIF